MGNSVRYKTEIEPGDVWLVNFPLEEDQGTTITRPAIVLDVETLQVLSCKVTKTPPRPNDKYDYPIVYEEHAKLRYKSTARISKIQYVPKDYFRHYIGTLHPDDWADVQMIVMQFIDSQQ